MERRSPSATKTPKRTSTPPPTSCKCIGVMNRLEMRRKCWQSSTPRRTSIGRVSRGLTRGKRRRIRGGRSRRKDAFRVEVCVVSSMPTCATAPLDVLTGRKGESMTEEGTLSILKLENRLQVRYASNNPHIMDRQSSTCTDAEHLGELLHQCGVDPWSIHQAFAELQKGGFTVLFIVLSAAQMEETSFMRADAGDTTIVDGEPLWGTRKGMRARLLEQKERNET